MLPKIEDIKRRRKILGLTQTKLAEMAGISQSLLVKIEAGRVSPTYDKAERIFLALESIETKNEKKATDVMNKNVLFAKENQEIKKVAALMKQKGISQLPVIDSHDIIIGSISERSILENQGKKLVSDALDDNLPTVSGKTPLTTVIDLLKHNSAILVFDKHKIVGIITKGDVI
jgi:predicted transcriptional regulator